VAEGDGLLNGSPTSRRSSVFLANSSMNKVESGLIASLLHKYASSRLKEL